jgi:hypothetical protein
VLQLRPIPITQEGENKPGHWDVSILTFQMAPAERTLGAALGGYTVRVLVEASKKMCAVHPDRWWWVSARTIGLSKLASGIRTTWGPFYSKPGKKLSWEGKVK